MIRMVMRLFTDTEKYNNFSSINRSRLIKHHIFLLCVLGWSRNQIPASKDHVSDLI
jgi:hypothetical protein